MMYNLYMQIIVDQNAINNICRTEDIAYLGLFGSRARNDAKSSSDVDILVDFIKTKSFFELARIQEKFEKVFDKKVDLVLKTTIKEPLKRYIKKDLITLYEKRS